MVNPVATNGNRSNPSNCVIIVKYVNRYKRSQISPIPFTGGSNKYEGSDREIEENGHSDGCNASQQSMSVMFLTSQVELSLAPHSFSWAQSSLPVLRLRCVEG